MSLREKAYDCICRKLLSGELVAGSRLSNRKLADEIGVSQIPVREAIAQLVSEGLAERRAGVGCFVASITREELAELYDLREALEFHAVRNAAERITEADLEVMRECYEHIENVSSEVESAPGKAWSAEQITKWRDADLQFHLTIFRAAGNRRALKTVQDLHLLTRMFARNWVNPPVSSPRGGNADHIALITLLEAADREGACDLIRDHIVRAARGALAAYDQYRMRGM